MIKYSDAKMPEEMVVKDVASVGFLLKDMDIDFINIDCKNNKIKEATQASEDIKAYKSKRVAYPMENWFLKQKVSSLPDGDLVSETKAKPMGCMPPNEIFQPILF